MRSALRRRIIAGLGLIVLAAGLAGPASASDQQVATSFINNLAGQAIGILQQPNLSLAQREAVVRDLLRQGFDVPFIGRFVLGRFWNRVGPEQREDYQDLFGEFLVKTYAARLGGYAGEQFAVVGVRDAGEKDSLVRTEIRRPSGPPLTCDWRVRVVDGQARIIDVMVEGVSMVVTQRSEFGALLQRDGIEGLLAALRAKTGRMTATAG